MHMHTRMRKYLGTNTCTRRSYSNQTLTILSSAPFPKGTPATSQQLEGADSVNPVGIKPDNQSCTLPGVNRYDESRRNVIYDRINYHNHLLLN